MRWLRSLRGRSEGPSRADVLAELELALHDPERHTRPLVAAAEDPESAEYGRTAAALEKWPPGRWLGLDRVRLDAGSYYGGEVEPAGGWSAAVRKRAVPTLLLVLASTHRDGFMRERATRLLAQRTGPLVSAALAVRAADHVTQVRDVALQALLERPAPADAVVIVPILLAARRREAAAGVLEDYVDGLPGEALRSLARSGNAETRRFAIERAPLTAIELVEIAATDGDLPARLAAARRAIALDEALARDLLVVRPASVRAFAVSVAADELVRPRLGRLLLDGSAHLRRAAQSRAGTLGVDAAAAYRDHLPARAAVLGLGEVGSEADVDRLTPLVGEQQLPAVRRAAVRALGRLAPRDRLRTLLPPLLEDDEASVAREAARQLRRCGFSLAGPRLERALASPSVWTRRAALGLGHGRRGWDVPVAALALYDDADESLREDARSALRGWLARKAPSAGTPTSEQAERLRASLERADLPADLERLIRFHAGLQVSR